MLRKPLTQVILFTSLAIAVASSLFFEEIKHTVRPEQTTNPEQAETYLFDTQITSLDETGAISQIIEAPSTVQVRETKVTNILKPKISLFKNNTLTWTASSDNATISADSQTMSLRDNVELTNPNHNTQLLTEQLDFDSAKQIATSKSPIVVNTKEADMTANGLQFNLADGHYQLKNKVIANYAR